MDRRMKIKMTAPQFLDAVDKMRSYTVAITEKEALDVSFEISAVSCEDVTDRYDLEHSLEIQGQISGTLQDALEKITNAETRAEDIAVIAREALESVAMMSVL